jgi:hypothetical protein
MMNIKTDYGTRQIVEIGFQMYRRFSPTIWQERIHTGEFHTILCPARVSALESQYVSVAPSTDFSI